MWRRQSIISLGGASTMSLPLKTVAAIFLLAGHAVSAGELPVNGFPTDADFFPIGVWAQSTGLAANYKAIGINTFVALPDGPTEAQLATLARQNMFAVTRQTDLGLNSPNEGVIRAWMQDDEPDNAQPLPSGGYGTCIPAAEVVRRTQELKSRDPTRPVLINFGQGVANEFWQGRGQCNGDQQYYDQAIQGADILSYDIYPVASRFPQVKGKLEYVARGVSNLMKRARDQQSVWMAIETTALDPNRRPTPAEVRSEVWMALIHGATGLFYFVNEFKPAPRADAIFRHPDVVEEVTKTDRMIQSLAPVLKSPSIDDAISVSSTTPIATMVKVFNNATYVFAVAMRNSPATARITLRGGRDARAQVLGEDRSINVGHGVFEDQFEGYGVHLYQIP